jgi:carboxyl-terminal processing protease
MRDADGDETVYRARGERSYLHPMVLLVDRGTASAAELFAGCMKVHRRALVVGETTYGKGVGVSFAPGPGGHHAVGAAFVLPDGSAIQGVGVHPDRPLSPLPPTEDLLAHAVELLHHVRQDL